jgi:hypothetical protein
MYVYMCVSRRPLGLLVLERIGKNLGKKVAFLMETDKKSVREFASANVSMGRDCDIPPEKRTSLVLRETTANQLLCNR